MIIKLNKEVKNLTDAQKKVLQQLDAVSIDNNDRIDALADYVSGIFAADEN